MAPSSAYASAPKNASTPLKIQTATIHGAEGRLRATRFGTRKMPAPMMVPTTIAQESSSPNLRGSSRADCISAHHATAQVPARVNSLTAARHLGERSYLRKRRDGHGSAHGPACDLNHNFAVWQGYGL